MPRASEGCHIRVQTKLIIAIDNPGRDTDVGLVCSFYQRAVMPPLEINARLAVTIIYIAISPSILAYLLWN